MALRFEWDPVKAGRNLERHGVGFLEAATVFGDPLSFTITDPDHSVGEQRYVTMGISYRGHLLVVVHRDAVDSVRIISARRASRAERLKYEEGT